MNKMNEKLLVIDASYSYEAVLSRNLVHSVTCRDLNGYFSHVYTIHPYASLVTSRDWSPVSGRPRIFQVNEKHSFIEACVGLVGWLEWARPINFLVAQAYLACYLVTLVKREQVSVIRASSPLSTGLLGLVVSRITRIPLLVRVGSNHEQIYKDTGRPIEKGLFMYRWLERLVERFVLSSADFVAGANHDNLDYALSFGAKKAKSAVFRYGNLIAPDHFSSPWERRVVDAEIRNALKIFDYSLGFVGRLEPVKLPLDAVEVLNLVTKKGLNACLIIVGDGSQKSEVCDRIDSLGLRDRVIFLGNRTQSELAQLYPEMDIVISPHTGRALTEAALAACAVVAYDVDWQRELIVNGVTGLMSQYGDWYDLGMNTCRLLINRSEADKFGRALRAKALEMMDPVLLDNKEQEVYSNLLRRV